MDRKRTVYVACISILNQPKYKCQVHNKTENGIEDKFSKDIQEKGVQKGQRFFMTTIIYFYTFS